MLIKNRVRIIAPAGKAKENSESILTKAIDLLEKAGFIVSVQDNIFAKSSPSFYASPKENRYLGLKNAIESDEVDIIWCFRGGYGSAEIADLCMDIKPQTPKILIGFSDVTYLHFLFNQFYHLCSIHGPVITSLVQKHPESVSDIISILQGEVQKVNLQPLNKAANKDIEGELIGGNLTIFTTLIGTSLHPKTKNKILLLEDINEPGYKIARMLNHIKKACLLDGLRAIIFGDFDGADDHLDDVIKAFISSNENLPIYKLENVGHGDINKSILFGRDAFIRSGILEYSLA